MMQPEESRDHYLGEFERNRARLPGFETLRNEARDRFAALGFPTRKDEAWRFTRVKPAIEIPYHLPKATANPNQWSALARGPLQGRQIAFVDGRNVPDFSAPSGNGGVNVSGLGAILRNDPASLGEHLGRLAPFDDHAFCALNTAFMRDGAVVRLDPDAAPSRPIHLLFLSSFHGEPYITHPRILIVAGKNARATIVESWIGPAGGVYLTNAVTEIALAEGASIEYVKVQRESPRAFHFATLRVRQERASTFTHHSISLGARLARHDLGSDLGGEGAETELNGLYEVTEEQHVDHHTTIVHASPHTSSRELYKGILGGKARGVFDGRLVVRPGAIGTDAGQTNKNLLLSKDALVHTKPQLEIHADDVKCRHGATVGQLDENVLFYLRSRGIGLGEARRLMVHAFASEIVDKVKIDSVRAQLGGCLGLLVGGP